MVFIASNHITSKKQKLWTQNSNQCLIILILILWKTGNVESRLKNSDYQMMLKEMIKMLPAV